jgi:hypothetical protein
LNFLRACQLALRSKGQIMFERFFLRHPRSVGESYGEHFVSAAKFAAIMVAAGVACLVHAFIPGLFVRTGSKAVEKLHDRMGQNRSRLERGRPDDPPSI